MSIGYLNLTQSAVLDIAGRGQVQFFPDTGEFWALSFVRISSNETFDTAAQSVVGGAISSATLHQGAQNVVDFTTQIDNTVLGNGDISSVIAGTVIQRGEAVTVKWSGGVPGAVVTMSLFGRTAETLPEIASLLPAIPGARFRGSDPSQLSGVDITYRNQVYNIPANSTVTDTVFNVYTTTGLYLKIDSNSAFQCRVRVKSRNGNNTNTLYEAIIPAGFFGTNLPVEIFLPNVTAQVQLEFTAPTGGATSVVVQASSSRNASGLPLTAFDRNVLYSSENAPVGPGVTSNVDINRVWPGRARLHIHTPNMTTWEMRLYYKTLEGVLVFISGMYQVNSYDQNTEVFLPAAPLRLQFQNTTVGNGNYTASLIGGEILKGEMS